MWFVYMVRCEDNTLYTGATVDLTRRLHEHNHTSKGARYTRSRRPVQLAYWVECKNRSEAQSTESRFKKLTRAQKENIIEGFKE